MDGGFDGSMDGAMHRAVDGWARPMHAQGMVSFLEALFCAQRPRF